MFLVVVCPTAVIVAEEDATTDAVPLLTQYCLRCHTGEKAKGEADLRLAVDEDPRKHFELFERAAERLKDGDMPPEGEPKPTDREKLAFEAWYEQTFVAAVEARPAPFAPRRLSVSEYRNTLRNVFGFELEVDVIEAEQTRTEKSLVVKLLPTDPPGHSGFTNDTYRNPLTSVIWDQYSYLIDRGLEQLFSTEGRSHLARYSGRNEGGTFNDQQLHQLVRRFLTTTYRRDHSEEQVEDVVRRIRNAPNQSSAIKSEFKAALMSPQFMYRGLLMELPAGRQPVDSFEYAERLSYFLWGDMPDKQLLELARRDELTSNETVRSQIQRMLAHPAARHLSETFAVEWLAFDDIDAVSNNPPFAMALRSQPLDFMNYLFTQNRPLIELIDSNTAFVNPLTSRFYPGDRKKLKRYSKPKGIEIEAVPNQMLELTSSPERGGILTMPGVLAMNRGPVIRGTWMLERILGQHLPDPPADVGQIPTNRPGQNLTFRERFELHRSKQTCAVCHDRIDPLGFALQRYDNSGNYRQPGTAPVPQKGKNRTKTETASGSIDTSGQLPTGEKFETFKELKQILTTTQREVVIRNIVRKTLAYALCRKLELYDQPAVDDIVKKMMDSNGTYGDLFTEIALSVPFRETIIAERQNAQTGDGRPSD